MTKNTNYIYRYETVKPDGTVVKQSKVKSQTDGGAIMGLPTLLDSIVDNKIKLLKAIREGRRLPTAAPARVHQDCNDETVNYYKKYYQSRSLAADGKTFPLRLYIQEPAILAAHAHIHQHRPSY